MAQEIPTREPTELTAGDSWRWDRTLSDYPPSAGWTLTYSLTGSHASVISIAAAASDDGATHEVRLTPATTAGYTAGRYDLIGHVSDGTDRFRVYAAALVVLPDPVTAAPALSYNERMLALLEAKIADRVSADVSSYSIEQQEAQREELRYLEERRNAYAEAVRVERGGSATRTVQVCFD